MESPGFLGEVVEPRDVIRRGGVLPGRYYVATSVRPVRFPDDELEAAVAAAAAAGLNLNAWVRRACRGAAELEAAIALEGEAALAHGPVVRELDVVHAAGGREFRPDFK
jgi:hypothetical protein